jgi:hypothetical protein
MPKNAAALLHFTLKKMHHFFQWKCCACAQKIVQFQTNTRFQSSGKLALL